MAIRTGPKTEDQAYVEWMDADYEAWAREHADLLEDQAYEDWASRRREDGEDASRDAWEQWCEDHAEDGLED